MVMRDILKYRSEINKKSFSACTQLDTADGRCFGKGPNQQCKSSADMLFSRRFASLHYSCPIIRDAAFGQSSRMTKITDPDETTPEIPRLFCRLADFGRTCKQVPSMIQCHQ